MSALKDLSKYDDEQLFDLAKSGSYAKENDDVTQFMGELVKRGRPLNSEGRNLLFTAFNEVIDQKRSAYRIVDALKQKKVEKGENGELLHEYLGAIREQISQQIKDIQIVADEALDHLDSDHEENFVEAIVFILNMKANYNGYLAETCEPESRKENTDSACKDYITATQVSEDLSATDPVRLNLALNYSVFLYEIAEDTSVACKTAKEAFDSAIQELDSLKEDSYKDSTLVMQILKENLALWTNDNEENPAE